MAKPKGKRRKTKAKEAADENVLVTATVSRMAIHRPSEDEFMAASVGDLGWLKQSLQGAPTGTTQVYDRNGLLSLHVAAMHGRLNCVRWLVEEQGVDVNAPSREGWRALHLCIRNENGKRAFLCLDYLLQHGASPHMANQDGLTPMHQASSSGHVQCVKALIAAKAKVDIVDIRGQTPIELAKVWGHRKCARILSAEKWHRDKEELARYKEALEREMALLVEKEEHDAQIEKMKQLARSSPSQPTIGTAADESVDERSRSRSQSDGEKTVLGMTGMKDKTKKSKKADKTMVQIQESDVTQSASKSTLSDATTDAEMLPTSQAESTGQVGKMEQVETIGQIRQRGQVSKVGQFGKMGKDDGMGQVGQMGNGMQIGKDGQMVQFGPALGKSGAMEQVGQLNQIGQLSQIGRLSQIGQMSQIGRLSQVGQMSSIGQNRPSEQMSSIGQLSSTVISSRQMSQMSDMVQMGSAGSTVGESAEIGTLYGEILPGEQIETRDGLGTRGQLTPTGRLVPIGKLTPGTQTTQKSMLGVGQDRPSTMGSQAARPRPSPKRTGFSSCMKVSKKDYVPNLPNYERDEYTMMPLYNMRVKGPTHRIDDFHQIRPVRQMDSSGYMDTSLVQVSVSGKHSRHDWWKSKRPSVISDRMTNVGTEKGDMMAPLIGAGLSCTATVTSSRLMGSSAVGQAVLGRKSKQLIPKGAHWGMEWMARAMHGDVRYRFIVTPVRPGRPVTYKPKHISDIHQKRHYDIDKVARAEVPIHMGADIRSPLVKPFLRDLKPCMVGWEVDSKASSPSNATSCSVILEK